MKITESASEAVHITVTLPPPTYERVRNYRHRHMFAQQKQALKIIIEAGLDALEKAERRKAGDQP